MFLWFGVDVDDHYAELKEKAKKIEEEIGFENSNFTLPFHISLKISFEIDPALKDGIVDDVSELFRSTKPFCVFTDKIECENNICWIRYKENDDIRNVQTKLNVLLNEKYGVPYHAYDLDFKFHTTLFMDDDAEKTKKAYELIKSEPIPEKIYADGFLMGRSENGDLGTYKIFGKITVK